MADSERRQNVLSSNDLFELIPPKLLPEILGQDASNCTTQELERLLTGRATRPAQWSKTWHLGRRIPIINLIDTSESPYNDREVDAITLLEELEQLAKYSVHRKRKGRGRFKPQGS